MIALGEPSLEPSQRVRIEKSSSAKIRELRLGQRGRKHGFARTLGTASPSVQMPGKEQHEAACRQRGESDVSMRVSQVIPAVLAPTKPMVAEPFFDCVMMYQVS